MQRLWPWLWALAGAGLVLLASPALTQPLRLGAVALGPLTALLLFLRCPLEPPRLGPWRMRHPLALALWPLLPPAALALLAEQRLWTSPSWLPLALSGGLLVAVLALCWRGETGRGGLSLLLAPLLWLGGLALPLVQPAQSHLELRGEQHAFLLYEVQDVGLDEIDTLRARMAELGVRGQVQLLGDTVQIQLEGVAEPERIAEELIQPSPGGQWTLVDVTER